MSQLLGQMCDFTLESIQFVFQFRRNSKHLPMMGDRRQNRLPYPPARVRNKTDASEWIEARNGFDQSQIAFVDQLVYGIPGSCVLLRHCDDKTQISLDQFSKRLFVALLNSSSKLFLFFRR